MPCRFPTTILGEARYMVEDTTFWRRPVDIMILCYINYVIDRGDDDRALQCMQRDRAVVEYKDFVELI